MTATTELQAYVRATLLADAPLVALCGGTLRFFDHVSDEAAFPYVFYEAGDTAEWDTSTEDGWETRPRIHVFSDAESSKPARLISGRIEELLHDTAPFVLTNCRVVLLRREGYSCIREPDGQVWHSLTSFRALLEET
jgi:hypothetical protein